MQKKLLSPTIRAFIEKQLDILERLSDQMEEFQEEYIALKRAYLYGWVDDLVEYAESNGVFDTPEIKNKAEKNFFLVEPIRRQGKISLDNYGVRCLTYHRRGEKENFFISEKVFWLAELKKFVKSHCFDCEDYNECLKAYELLEGIQRAER